MSTMNTTECPGKVKRYAIGAVAGIVVLAAAAGGVVGMRKLQAQRSAKLELLETERQAVRQNIELTEQMRKDISNKAEAYREDVHQATGLWPTSDQEPLAGYKRQLVELGEKVARNRETMSRIEKEIARLSGR